MTTEINDFDTTTGRTIINNILTTLTTLTTNNNIYNLSPQEEEQISMECYASRVGSPSETASQDIPGQVTPVTSLVGVAVSEAQKVSMTETIIDSTIPENWDYIKIDLFNNATMQDLAKNKNKFKVSISIKLKNKTDWQVYRSELNSPFRHLKRGLDSEVYDGPHYTMVKNNYHELKSIYPKTAVSKCYEKSTGIKGQTVEELTVVLSQTEEVGGYLINLHFGDTFWLWQLSTSLTDKQRKGNMIASVGVRRANKVKNLSARALLG